MRRAYERAGFVVQRFEYPSQLGRTDGGAQPKPELAHRPGAILFRKIDPDGGRVALELLYLVGETSTGGVDREALAIALRERA